MKTPGELFESGIPLATRLASRKCSTTPPQVAFDELWGAALEGLWRAANRYDSSNGARFSTFCTFAIRGSMQDHLRSLSRTPRSSPEPAVFSLDGDRLWDLVDHSPGPVDLFLAKEEIELMLSALGTIREPCRTILRQHYLEGRPMKEIAFERGITTGRVSQIALHGRGLMKYAMESDRS